MPQQIGLADKLKKKLQEGQGVSHHDLLDICELISHNATQMNKVVNRVKVLEQQLTPPPKEPTQATVREDKEEELAVLYMFPLGRPVH